VVLLDYAENSLRVMQQLARETGKTVYLVQGDAFHLPFRTESWMACIIRDCWNTFADPSGILAEN
jgi:ubiquinone/menaquinone biosynthesis C-methylase UbiE